MGMLALLAGIETLIDTERARFMTPHELDWREGRRVAERDVTNAEVLIFGDSMLKFGLSPMVLESRLGKAAYSLALLDGKPPASYFLFRRALDHGARPRAVLVDFQPECMFQSVGSLMENRHWKGLLSLRECLDLGWTYRDADFFARTALQVMFPSLRCRGEMRAQVLLALKGRPNPNIDENAKVRRNRSTNRGGMLLAKQPTFQGEIPASYDGEVMFSDRWINQPEHTVYVRKFMKLAEDHGIPVFWLLPPNSPKVLALRDEAGLNARYDRFIQAVQYRYSDVRVVDARRAGFDNTLFVDPVHLDRDGATAFTLGVAEILRPFLARPFHKERARARWVTLPPSRGMTVAIALEDVEQSKAAITSIQR
jgi:hypothetical protein